MEENDATFDISETGSIDFSGEGRLQGPTARSGGSTNVDGNLTIHEFNWDSGSDSGDAETNRGSGTISVDVPESPSTGNNPTQKGEPLTEEAENAFASSTGSGPRVDEGRGNSSGSTTKRIYNNIGELEAEVKQERENIGKIVEGLVEKSKKQQQSLQGKINQAGQKHNQLAKDIFAKLPSVSLPSPSSPPLPVPPTPENQPKPQTPLNAPLGRQVERTYFHHKYAETFAPEQSAPLTRNASRVLEQADKLASHGQLASASKALEVADSLLGVSLNPEFSDTDILDPGLPDVSEGTPEGNRLRDAAIYRNYVRERVGSEAPIGDNISPTNFADLGIDVVEELSGSGAGNDLNQLIDNTLVALDVAIGLTPIASTAKGIVSLGTNTNPITGERISDLEALDIVLDFVPVVGTAKDIISLATGTNPITNEELSDFDKVVVASGLLLPSVLGGTAKNIVKNGIKKTSEILQRVASKGKKSSETANQLLEKSRKFEDDLTGTVWDSITENGDAYPGTAIPKSFSLEIDGSKFYVPDSASKHMADHIASPGMGATKSAVVRSQAMLTSFKASVEEAKKTGIVRNSKIRSGAWELIFKEPTATHDTFKHSIIHAVFMGGK